jgi:hypothetical protein
MRIRKHENKNEYIRTPEGFWVRNFTKAIATPRDINGSIDKDDYRCIINNEFNNKRAKLYAIDEYKIEHPHIVIVSDGYKFEEKQWLLPNVPTAAIIGVNGALAKWKLVGDGCPTEKRRAMYYVVNNPYEECMSFYPRKHRYFPMCIASTRTNHKFIEKYQGEVYRYTPTPEEGFTAIKEENAEYKIDDYRNAICAAIGLAYRFGVMKLLLLCCDDAFEEERPGAISTEKGTWMYPQQKISHNLIDANLHWLKQQEAEIEIAEYSSGPYYKNATYIETEEEVTDFFKIENEREE